MEIAINLLIFLLAGYWFQQGIAVYKFWGNNQPGSGFIPVLFALVLMVMSLLLLVRAILHRKKDDTKEPEAVSDQDSAKIPLWIRPLIPAGYAVVSIGALVLLGVIPAMFLTSFVWMKWVSKVPLVKSLTISTIVTVFVYLIFVFWLRIPFPRGIFGI